MKVELLNYTPLEIAIKAIRMCYRSEGKSDNLGEKDKKLIRMIIKSGHTSVFEHCKITFFTNEPDTLDFFKKNRYTYETNGLITTNLRVLIENKYYSRFIIYKLLSTEMGFIFDEYKIHPDFPLYKIYNFGIIEKFNKINKNDATKIPKAVKPFINKYGYPEVILSNKNNIRKHKSIHRLIAECFIHNPDPENKIQANHINGIKTNNEIYNLEWVTPSENEQHSYDVLGKQPWNKGKKLPSGREYRGKIRTVYQYTLDDELIKEWFNPTEAANELGLSLFDISHCAEGRQKICGGFKWRYKDEDWFIVL